MLAGPQSAGGNKALPFHPERMLACGRDGLALAFAVFQREGDNPVDRADSGLANRLDCGPEITGVAALELLVLPDILYRF